MEIKPMLAHKYNPDKIQYPAYIQPKLDGVRCIFTKDGAFSRTGKQFKNLRHIESALYSLFVTYPKLILDGELYNHELKHDFEKILFPTDFSDESYDAFQKVVDYAALNHGEIGIFPVGRAAHQKRKSKSRNRGDPKWESKSVASAVHLELMECRCCHR